MHNKAKLGIYLAVAILLIANAMAIGIAPGTIDTEFGTEKKILIINNEHKDFNVAVYAEGSLADYIEISESMISMSADENTREIKVKIIEPDYVSPGKLTADLIVMELPDGQKSTISTRQAVISKISATVPYPGKFAEAKLKIPDADAQDPIDFVIKITSKGKKTIERAKARIDVFSPSNELLVSLHTDEKPVQPGETRELVARYHNGLPEGRYYARAVVDYDGNEIELEKTFDIGNMLIVLHNIKVKQFTLGSIAKFDIMIENTWNEQIPDVYANLGIRDKYGKAQTEFKTSEIDIMPGDTEILNAYWDTSDISPGRYSAQVTLHFIGNNIQKSMTLNVGEDGIDIDFMPTGMVIEQSGPTKRDSYIIILVVLSMIVNALLIIYFARRRR